jgi:hypothetical protein
MAKIRIGLGSEFNLNNSNLGLGVTNPQVRLDVDGTVKSKDFEVTGVTSFTAYEGFLRSDHQIDGDLTLNTGQGLNASLSGEIIVKDGTTVTVGAVGLGTTSVGIGTTTALKTTTIDSNAVNLAGGSQIECMKVFNTFTPPSGGTNERPYAPKPGELYYNYDLKTIEFHDGYGWRQVDNTTRSGRVVFGGGYVNSTSSMSNMVEYIQSSTLGNAIDFGILTESGANKTAMSSDTRGLFSGGGTPEYTNTIDYVTIASAGNAIDFGDGTTTNSWGRNGLSSSTRGLMGGGYPAVNVIDYVQIHTLGDALDFGDLTVQQHSGHGVSSPTRGLWGGGNDSGTRYDAVDSVTIASTGNAIDFGTLIVKRTTAAAFSSSTRGIWSGGNDNSGVPSMEYINIASGGNSQYFGDTTIAATYRRGNGSNTRGFSNGGRTPTFTNIIEYVTIATAGNALDFGDLSRPRVGMGVASDSHGGLGGF